MDKLNIETSFPDSETVKFNLSGQIDEDFVPDTILKNTRKSMIINFQAINMINSCGVREWINLLEKISGSKILYQECPQIVIEQINMVHGFINENSTVESFFAPYYSEKNDKVVKILLQSSQVINSKAPKIEVDSEELEFDAIEAQYFQFLKQKG